MTPILFKGELKNDGGQDLSPEVEVLRTNGPTKSSVGNEDAAPLQGAIFQVGPFSSVERQDGEGPAGGG